MNKKTLLTTCMSFALVMAFATSGFAAIWSWSPPSGLNAEVFKKIPYIEWTSGDINIEASPTLSALQFTFDFIAKGSWDGIPGTKPDKLSTVDNFTFQIFRGTTALVNTTFNTIDNPETTPRAEQTVHLAYLLPNISGVYTIKAIGKMTASDESWIMTGASVSGGTTPTPLPGAVWMLGSGLLGFMGFKRARKIKNAA